MSRRNNTNNNNNNNNDTKKSTKKDQSASSAAASSGAIPDTIMIDGRQVNVNDLEQNALFDYLKKFPETRSAKRCAVFPDCAKGRECSFAHIKSHLLPQFLAAAGTPSAATVAHGGTTHAPNPREDKALLAYAGLPETITVDGHNCSIHELEPNGLFKYLLQNPDKTTAKSCAKFPNCPMGKDCSFAHLKATRMNALISGNASSGSNGNNSKAKKANNTNGSSRNNNDDYQDDSSSPRGLLAYEGLPSYVLVDGHHMSIHDLEPNNLFNYFHQHPTSPTARRCQSFPFCGRGKDCSFAHLKAVKLKALQAALEREKQANNTTVPSEYKGLPSTVLIDNVVINIQDLEPNALFTYLRENGDAQAARRCQFFPQCPKGKSCGFAHVKYNRVNAANSMSIHAKPSPADYNGLPDEILIEKKSYKCTDLEPTLMFDYIRLHPDADNMRRCRNFPYCRSGRSCGYAHLKSDRAAAISGMPAFLTIEEERVDVLKTLHPTAMFNYARKHPEATNIRWCKHWPNCNDGDACTYAHKKM